MICKVCGRTIANEDANFCEYCGSSFREGYQAQPVITPMAAEKAVAPAKAIQSKEGKPVSVLNWLLILVLPFIPYVGIIAFIVLLCMWGFGRNSKENVSRRNFARAMLIVVAVVVVLIFAASYVMASNFINSGLSWSDYINQLMNTMYSY